MVYVFITTALWSSWYFQNAQICKNICVSIVLSILLFQIFHTNHLGMHKWNKLGNVHMILPTSMQNDGQLDVWWGTATLLLVERHVTKWVLLLIHHGGALTSYFLGPVSICILSRRWEECIYRMCTKGPEYRSRNIYEVLVPRQWIFAYTEQWEKIQCRGSWSQLCLSFHY